MFPGLPTGRTVLVATALEWKAQGGDKGYSIVPQLVEGMRFGVCRGSTPLCGFFRFSIGSPRPHITRCAEARRRTRPHREPLPCERRPRHPGDGRTAKRDPVQAPWCGAIQVTTRSPLTRQGRLPVKPGVAQRERTRRSGFSKGKVCFFLLHLVSTARISMPCRTSASMRNGG